MTSTSADSQIHLWRAPESKVQTIELTSILHSDEYMELEHAYKLEIAHPEIVRLERKQGRFILVVCKTAMS